MTDDDDDEDEDESEALELMFEIGDMSRPANPATGPAVLLHVVDDSGRWGKGGLFDVLATLSSFVPAAYQSAADMEDLELGSAHIIQLDVTRPDSSAVYVALVVAQSRDRHGRVTGIDLSALDEGLLRVAHFAAGHAASVHLARIGHATPNFNWSAFVPE